MIAQAACIRPRRLARCAQIAVTIVCTPMELPDAPAVHVMVAGAGRPFRPGKQRSYRWSAPGRRRAEWARTPLRRYLENRRILRYPDVPTKLAVDLNGSRRGKRRGTHGGWLEKS